MIADQVILDGYEHTVVNNIIRSPDEIGPYNTRIIV